MKALIIFLEKKEKVNNKLQLIFIALIYKQKRIEATAYILVFFSLFFVADHMCSELCADASVECDSITGNCVCDPMDRNVEWCRAGKVSY